jgi:hypothetical protein
MPKVAKVPKMPKNAATASETVSQCHCEGVKRPKQSHNALEIKEIATLPLVARNDKEGL